MWVTEEGFELDPLIPTVRSSFSTSRSSTSSSFRHSNQGLTLGHDRHRPEILRHPTARGSSILPLNHGNSSSTSSIIMGKFQISKGRYYLDKLAIESEPGLTTTQLMLTNHDLKPVEPERRQWGAWNFVAFWIGKCMVKYFQLYRLTFFPFS
jgi:hypothetical protein